MEKKTAAAVGYQGGASCLPPSYLLDSRRRGGVIVHGPLYAVHCTMLSRQRGDSPGVILRKERRPPVAHGGVTQSDGALHVVEALIPLIFPLHDLLPRGPSPVQGDQELLVLREGREICIDQPHPPHLRMICRPGREDMLMNNKYGEYSVVPMAVTLSGAGSSAILARVMMPNWPSPPRTA